MRLLCDYVAYMLLPPELTADEEGIATGSRVGTAGWPLWGNVRLVRAGESGRVEFDGIGVSAFAPRHVRTSVVLDGHEIPGTPVPLDDDYLVRDGRLRGTMRPDATLLTEFLQLGPTASAQAFAAFARAHGLLGLAPLSRPRPVTAHGWVPDLGTILAPRLGYAVAPRVQQESLGLWRRISREVGAIARIGAALRSGTIADRDEWAALSDVMRFPLRSGEVTSTGSPIDNRVRDGSGAWVTLDSDSPNDQRTALIAVLGAWMSMGAVVPAMAWTPGSDQPFIALSVSTLFGGIVLQLAASVAGAAGLVLCSNCSTPFIPERRPSARQLSGERGIYCASCRRSRVPARSASARWRSRNPEYFRERRKNDPARHDRHAPDARC